VADGKWVIQITAPDGSEDHGSITLLSIAMSPQELAHRMADIAWRITYDLAELARQAAEGGDVGELTREPVSE
jgi:hypothetical protein